MMRRVLFFVILFAAVPLAVFAATFSFSPPVKDVYAGQIFSIDIVVSSPDQAINAISGDVSFPTSRIKVVSLEKGDSIISLWVRNPSFSNAGSEGDINFEGVVLNPGWTGNNGIVLKATFQALTTGPASIAFSGGSVLANDGNGTEILTGNSPANIAVAPAPPQSAAPIVSASTSTPEVSSSFVQPTSTPLAPTTTTPVIVNGWFGESSALLFDWCVLMILTALLLIMIIFLIISIRRESRNASVKTIIRKRKELRDDLTRIEKELEVDREASRIDLSPSGVRKREARIKREIDHLEEDLKEDL